MYRRLYFLFPDEIQTRRVVDELHSAGIQERHVHAVARGATEFRRLPAATRRQSRDACCTLETVLWNTNLVVFGLALAVLVISLVQGFAVWSVLALVVMGATFVAGERFAAMVPRVHLNEFREALAHGEILLMVDVPRGRVAEIEDLVHRRHPEAAVGGVGYSIPALGL